MRRLLYFPYILLLVIVSCKNKSGDSSNKTEDQKPTQEKSWCKRYTGTIAGQAVIVNLAHQGKDEIKGTYYYVKTGILLDLDNDNDSTKDNHYCIYESAGTERSDENDYHNNNHWSVTITGDKIAGKWVSLDNKKTYDIDLKEDYSDGAYRFYMMFHGDSIAIKNKNGNIGATSTFLLSLPSAEIRKKIKISLIPYCCRK